MAKGMELHVHNLEIVLDKITKFGGGAEGYLGDLLFQAAHDDLWPRWIAQISLTDHTLQQLADLDYPYSTRYDIDSFVHKDEFVHEQSGNLVESSSIERVNKNGKVEVRIINKSPHYIFLRYGTYKMRPRDPGGAALRDAMPAIRERFKAGLKGLVQSNLRMNGS